MEKKTRGSRIISGARRTRSAALAENRSQLRPGDALRDRCKTIRNSTKPYSTRNDWVKKASTKQIYAAARYENEGFGSTRDVASLEPLALKFRGFGLAVEEIDGHSPEALDAALAVRHDKPLVVLLRTVKGRGVSFMEGRMEWHYLPLNESQYQLAIRELTEV